jgi:hypothetical protein
VSRSEGISPHEGADLSEGAIIADQWERNHNPARLNSNEKRLMFAILEQALATVINSNMHGGNARKTKYGVDQTERRQLREIERDRQWIADRENWDFGSFNAIWSTLFPDYDIERARREILRNPVQVGERLKALKGYWKKAKEGGADESD